MPWFAAGHHPVVSVNLSGPQLSDPRLTDLVRDLLAETGLPGAAVPRDHPESVLMEDAAATMWSRPVSSEALETFLVEGPAATAARAVRQRLAHQWRSTGRPLGLVNTSASAPASV